MMKSVWILGLLLAGSTLAFADADKSAKARAAFERMDQQDLQDGIEAANNCAKNRDFVCAQQHLDEVKALTNSSADDMLFAMASQNLQREKDQLALELRLQREAEERQRQEQQRLAEAERQRQQQAAQQQGGMQWGKLAALGVGAGLGGLGKLPADQQVKLISGMFQDSAPGQNGISNFQNAASSIAPSGSGAGSTGTAGAGGGDEAARNRAIAQRCEGPAKAYKPWNDPQVDTFCQLAAFDKCLADAGIMAYESERRQVCSVLKGTLQSIGGNISSCAPCN
ncbi:MAG: hypothetical protein REI12_14040 [Pedobacter sp.]|nr:hypothetical protein [Pedobacter sp.]